MNQHDADKLKQWLSELDNEQLMLLWKWITLYVIAWRHNPQYNKELLP